MKSLLIGHHKEVGIAMSQRQRIIPHPFFVLIIPAADR